MKILTNRWLWITVQALSMCWLCASSAVYWREAYNARTGDAFIYKAKIIIAVAFTVLVLLLMAIAALGHYFSWKNGKKRRQELERDHAAHMSEMNAIISQLKEAGAPPEVIKEAVEERNAAAEFHRTLLETL